MRADGVTNGIVSFSFCTGEFSAGGQGFASIIQRLLLLASSENGFFSFESVGQTRSRDGFSRNSFEVSRLRVDASCAVEWSFYCTSIQRKPALT